MIPRDGGVPGAPARCAAPAFLLFPGVLAGQTPDVPVAGRVVDEAGRPLAGAVVEVPSSFVLVETGAAGRFALRLPPGAARLRVHRIGYATAVVDVVVMRDGMAPVVVRLRPDPIALRGISVEAPRSPPLGRTVTTETVRQAPPLGEPDVSRAVVLPGVAQPNDLKEWIHLPGRPCEGLAPRHAALWLFFSRSCSRSSSRYVRSLLFRRSSSASSNSPRSMRSMISSCSRIDRSVCSRDE